MASVNKAIIIGNLGADPELRYTSGGQAVCRLRIATGRKYKNRDGEWTEDTQWHRVVVWGCQAESCHGYLKKGRSVYVEGRIQTRQWEDGDGNKRWATEIVANNVTFLGGRSDSGQSGTGSQRDDQVLADSGDDGIPF